MENMARFFIDQWRHTVSKIETTLIPPEAANIFPSFENETDITDWLWPSNVLSAWTEHDPF